MFDEGKHMFNLLYLTESCNFLYIFKYLYNQKIYQYFQSLFLFTYFGINVLVNFKVLIKWKIFLKISNMIIHTHIHKA